MGRGKSKRKMKQKIKRIKKIKKGIHVPFSLANSPRKLVGRSHKHDFGTNIHNLIYVEASFKNVKYTSSNITSCNFRNAKFTGIDFINTNLKKSKFKNAHFENVIFYTANLKGVDFLNATFKNVYFINTNLSKTKNIDINNPNVHVLKGSPNLELSPSLVTSINQLMTIQKFSKHFVLTTKNSNGKKINSWIIYLLLKNFSEDELTRGFNRLYSNNKSKSNKNMHTYYSYLEFLSKYFEKMI
ncbi:pentapeptide repeat-containing protein [Lysinibacillus fusiformis]|uniref:pentapeptide repeat-containing protein n=1 Tax=Lysinibacillus fusiformis TaxID=28031 RepID=UPI00263B0B1A|nr:pentapeptide repeat-containing protein [Lysinibacillus fusiformis]MDC6269268.1 pentapeptide repeat-containing protein [Lysinibacillus sphaericus]MDN4970957.1 pentapeptide repeat-containing protein [Lysinibacillus fusiformis]